ncbi:MAG: type II secretion system protein [Acidobacteria bacterium]|nr:type II secretion system protein [Acidobacteriota bacterium]
MAALLVMLGIMLIMLTVALPVWRQMVKRDKEAELVFRGEQYARAIVLFQRKYANALPPTLDVLVEQHFLRKKYKDPMTGDDFQPIPASSLSLTPSSSQGARTPGAQATPVQPVRPGAAVAPRPGGSSAPTGLAGGIAGVASKSKDKSIRIFNGRDHYNEWQFLFTSVTMQPGGMPGNVRPGGVPGLPGRGQPGPTPGIIPGMPTTPLIPRTPRMPE